MTWALVTLRRIALAAVLAAIVLGVGDRDVPRAGGLPELNVLVVVDRTTSMSALDDPTGSRITAARRDLIDLGRQLDSARFTVVTAGQDAHVELPPTSDRVAFEDAVGSLQVEAADAGSGSAVDRFVPVVDRLLDRQHRRRLLPVLVYVGDGENTGGWDTRAVGALHGRLQAAVVLGYGTPEGGVMPLTRVDPGAAPPDPARAGPLVPDVTTGAPAVSHSSPTELEALAATTEGRYVPCDGSQDMALVATALQRDAYADLPPVRAARQLGWLWGLLLLLFAVPELRAGWRQWLEARREARS